MLAADNWHINVFYIELEAYAAVVTAFRAEGQLSMLVIMSHVGTRFKFNILFYIEKKRQH